MRPLLEKDMWLSLINTPWVWKIVSSLFLPEQPAVKNRRYQEWTNTHSHAHQHREVLVGLKGHCLYGFEGHLYKCQPGTLFLFNHFEKHDLSYPPETTGVVHLWLTIIHDRIIGRVLKVTDGCLDMNIKGRVFQTSDAGLILERCWSELSGRTVLPVSLRQIKIISALAAVLVLVAEHDFRTPGSAEKYDQRQEAVITIRKYIEATAGKGVSLADIVRITGYSKFHFLHLFKKYTGQTMYYFIHACRIKKVKTMLESGCRKKEIAYELGFSGGVAISEPRLSIL